MATTEASATAMKQVASEQQSLPVTAKIHKIFRSVYKVVHSSLGLIIALTIYSCIGAAIFTAIEGGREEAEKSEIRGEINEIRQQMINNTWLLSQSSGDSERKFSKLVQQELKIYEEKIHEAFVHGVSLDSDPDEDIYVWDFWGSFLFCFTVYTTIGYGHIAPATTEGRVACMLYALIGIPLCLIVMAELGKKITLFIKFLWSFVRRFRRTGSCKKIKTAPAKVDGKMKADDESSPAYVVDDDFNLPPVIAIVITLTYICAGAGMYMRWEENWNYLDAFYFIFISISTVGFGDVLPEHPHYFLASSIYILLGLSLVAMVINVIMEVVSNTIDKAKVKVIETGQKIGINLAIDDLDKESTKKKTNGDPPAKS